ncbi:MAG: SOS response-associated peptidase [Lachnospiraceae bacterium]|jgi:putative SOS response-associated peptidase YedK|nr:SOS response-associated peptidase [Lachnospiraceae bacterium]
MCGRYSTLTEDEIIEVREIIRSIAKRLSERVVADGWDSNGSVDGSVAGSLGNGDIAGAEIVGAEIAPTNRAPIITGKDDELFFDDAAFGFAKWDGKGVIINARAETLSEKPFFSRHLTHGRCVVPASGYLEWKEADDGKGKKIKHMIKDEAGNLLFMAGLWRDGDDGREFVIITKEPVGEIVAIHSRMPVILRIDQIEAWLSGAMTASDLAELTYAELTADVVL